jgi:outer membrane protein assembly factor BamA
VLEITVKESFYLLPVPIFSLADRNFNVWWTEQNRSLDRINYGLFVLHRNLTGSRDPLQLMAQFGYTPKIGLSYSFPALNKSQTLGGSLSFSQSKNREIGFKTDSNLLRFFRFDDQQMIKSTQASVGLRLRPAINTTHSLTLSYSKIEISDTIAGDLNPNYLGDGRNSQRVSTISYNYSLDKRDFRPYPRSGFSISASISRNGLMKNEDVQNTPISVSYQQYLPINKTMTLELYARGRMDLSDNQNMPLNFSRGMGFGNDYLRGYELYVIDGVKMGFVRSSLRQKLFEKEADLGKYMIWKAWRKLPIEINISGNFDVGGTQNPNATLRNSYQNKTLWSYGTSLDFIFYKTMVVQVQYSITHEGKGGLFLHFRSF